MNADLTFNSVAFKKNYDVQTESLRRSVTRGINIPDDLIIRSQDYTDTGTKVPGTRSTVRVDRHSIDSITGQKYITSFYVVAAIPSLAVDTDVSTALATFKAAVADTDLLTNVLAGQK